MSKGTPKVSSAPRDPTQPFNKPVGRPPDPVGPPSNPPKGATEGQIPSNNNPSLGGVGYAATRPPVKALARQDQCEDTDGDIVEDCGRTPKKKPGIRPLDSVQAGPTPVS